MVTSHRPAALSTPRCLVLLAITGVLTLLALAPTAHAKTNRAKVTNTWTSTESMFLARTRPP